MTNVADFAYIPHIQYGKDKLALAKKRALQIQDTPVKMPKGKGAKQLQKTKQAKRDDTLYKAQGLYNRADDPLQRHSISSRIVTNDNMPEAANAELAKLKGLHVNDTRYAFEDSFPQEFPTYQQHRRLAGYQEGEVPLRLTTTPISRRHSDPMNKHFKGGNLNPIANQKRLDIQPITQSASHPDFDLLTDAKGKQVFDSGHYMGRAQWMDIPIPKDDPNLVFKQKNQLVL